MELGLLCQPRTLSVKYGTRFIDPDCMEMTSFDAFWTSFPDHPTKKCFPEELNFVATKQLQVYLNHHHSSTNIEL